MDMKLGRIIVPEEVGHNTHLRSSYTAHVCVLTWHISSDTKKSAMYSTKPIGIRLIGKRESSPCRSVHMLLSNLYRTFDH